MTKEYNEYKDYTLSELWDLFDNLNDRLKVLNAAPINYYSAGYSETYHSAMSQMWGIDACKKDLRKIREEIERRNQEEEDNNG